LDRVTLDLGYSPQQAMPTPKERGKLARNLSFLRQPMCVVFRDPVDQSVMRVADAFTVVLW
jgi:hypothetical protein